MYHWKISAGTCLKIHLLLTAYYTAIVENSLKLQGAKKLDVLLK